MTVLGRWLNTRTSTTEHIWSKKVFLTSTDAEIYLFFHESSSLSPFLKEQAGLVAVEPIPGPKSELLYAF
jgi:hypothetical protein